MPMPILTVSAYEHLNSKNKTDFYINLDDVVWMSCPDKYETLKYGNPTGNAKLIRIGLARHPAILEFYCGYFEAISVKNTISEYMKSKIIKT